MNYFKLLGARRRSGRVPTMAPQHWTDEQRKYAATGRCVECGGPNAGTRSYLCSECQGKSTLADIRDEIDALRRKLLN
jgi:hypothetical protein